MFPIRRMMITKRRDEVTAPDREVLRDEGGFTLLEVMISGAITLLIALAISSMLVQMKKQETRNEDRSVQFEQQQSISYSLRFNPVPP